MEDYTRIAKRLQPLYPTGAGKGLRSTSVKLLVQGSKCKLKCKANTYRSQNNEVVKHYDDSVSCKHLVASLIGLFNRLGWDSDEVLDLILGSDTFQAFEWLRSLDEPEEMFRNIWQDSYTSAEVTKFNKQTREDGGVGKMVRSRSSQSSILVSLAARGALTDGPDNVART